MEQQKGYELLEPAELDGLIRDARNHDVAIAVLCWLAREVKRTLPAELARVDVEVLFIHRGYPCLGLHYEVDPSESVSDIVARTIGELLAGRSISELVAFASGDAWLATRKQAHVGRSIGELAKRIDVLAAKYPSVSIEVTQRALGETLRLKLERSMSDHRRYVDFHFNADPDPPLTPCFVWSFGEYAHGDHQQNFDGKRYGLEAHAEIFAEEWVFRGVPLEDLPDPHA